MAAFIGLCICIIFCAAQDEFKSSVGVLVENLRSGDADVREEATRKIKDLGEAARTELEKAAKDNDLEVKGRAQAILRLLDVRKRLTPRLLKAMPGIDDRLALGEVTWARLLIESSAIDGIRRRYPDLRRQDLDPIAPLAFNSGPSEKELQYLCLISEKRHLTSVADALVDVIADKDRSYEIKSIAIRALSELKPSHVAPRIYIILQDYHKAGYIGLLDKDTFIRLMRVLGDIDSKLAYPLLMNLLESADPYLRKAAIDVLGSPQFPVSPNIISGLLTDPNNDIRTEATWFLARRGQGKAIPLLIELLKNPRHRCSAVYYLGRLKAREAIPQLSTLLLDNTDFCDQAAAFSLIEMGDKDSCAVLLKANEPANRPLNALLYYGGIAPIKVRQELIRLLRYDNDNIIRGACSGIVALDVRDAIPILNTLFEKGMMPRRLMAAQALAEFGETPIIPQLRKWLDDEDPYIKGLAAGMLGRLQCINANKDICNMLKDSSRDVRLLAAISLSEMGFGDALPAIAKLLEDDDSYVRLYLTNAMGGGRDPNVISHLVRMLGDENWMVRIAAAQWLCEYGKTDGVDIIMEEGKTHKYIYYNALRKPREWKRMTELKMPRGRLVFGSAGDILGRMSDRCNVKLEHPPDEWFGSVRWMRNGLENTSRYNYSQEANIVEQVLGDYYGMIMEDSLWRIVSIDEAREFWEKWRSLEVKDGR